MNVEMKFVLIVLKKLTRENIILCPVCRTGEIGHFIENEDGLDKDRIFEF